MRTRQINLRLTEEEYARLEALALRISVTTIARIALFVGLPVVEAQPGILLGEEPEKR